MRFMRASGFGGAVKTIILADLVMSIDNDSLTPARLNRLRPPSNGFGDIRSACERSVYSRRQSDYSEDHRSLPDHRVRGRGALLGWIAVR